MAFADGWVIWAIHGVQVPERVVTAPDTLTIAQIQQERNAEVQRVMLERFGWDRYLNATAATLRHVDTEPTGAAGLRGLYQYVLHGAPQQVLVCCCASTGKTFHLQVPPEVETCQQAAAWLANTEGKPLNLLVRT